jgi:hypothetical protein
VELPYWIAVMGCHRVRGKFQIFPESADFDFVKSLPESKAEHMECSGPGSSSIYDGLLPERGQSERMQ